MEQFIFCDQNLKSQVIMISFDNEISVSHKLILRLQHMLL